MLKKITIHFLLLLCTCLTTNAQTPVQKLQQAFTNFQNDPQTKYGIAAICVLDAGTGETLFARNEQTGLATASTLKTITSATAFSLLGQDFKFQTNLAYSGAIDNTGTLKGNLIVIGGGDPTLASWRYETSREKYILDQWVNAIRQAGIKRIEGNVIGDDSLWGTQTTPDGWIWQDIGNYYGAGASALNWRENQFDLHLRASRSDQGVSIQKVVPEMPYLQFVNEMKAGAEGSGDQVYAYLPPLATTAYLRGTWALGIGKSGISAALPDPAFDAAFRLQDTLRRIGIAANQPPATARMLKARGTAMPPVTKTISTLNSPELGRIVYWFNRKSINLYGEALLKALAWKSGREATTRNGAAALTSYWAGRGLAGNALNIMDGSGLSPATRVTAAAMAQVLFLAQKESWFPAYYESLPENNGMKLKSGTINDVSAFAGYYTSGSGKKYVIVININNYSGSGINKKLFRVLDTLK